MKRSKFFLGLFFMVLFGFASTLQVIREGAILAITIRADGSISPSFSPISTADNVTYTLTDNIASDTVGIVVERNNIIVEGAGHYLYGFAKGTGLALLGVRNVTIRNVVITDFDVGLVLAFASNNTLSLNNVTSIIEGVYLYNSFDNNLSCNVFSGNELYGIELLYSSGNILSYNKVTNNSRGGILLRSSSNNTWSGNSVTENGIGIVLFNSFDNKFFHNNFSKRVRALIWLYPNSTNAWDNGQEGNYWSDYNGTDSNQDGIGDTPYIIDKNNIDHYPLMTQYIIPEFPSLLVIPLFMAATLLAIAIYKRRHLT